MISLLNCLQLVLYITYNNAPRNNLQLNSDISMFPKDIDFLNGILRSFD